MAFLAKGEILEGRYQIIEEIGSGGGGIAYKATDLKRQSYVVVKQIKDEYRGKMKLRQEADILKNLRHLYLPEVRDFIETENGVYTVMEFIHGENLDQAVKLHGKYPQKQVRKWAEQLGEALDYLHRQEPPIIHSDIKPANIMITEEGNVCLIDFNISLAMDGTAKSAVGVSIGFSPPEQYHNLSMYMRFANNLSDRKPVKKVSYDDATEVLMPENKEDGTEILSSRSTEGRDGEDADDRHSIGDNFARYIQLIGKGIDERSDIYSLGVTLYFALTGIVPPIDFFSRLPVSKCGVPVSEGFAIVLNKMMELSKEDRYQTGGEFLKAVQNCYKLDSRYVIMHQKQVRMQVTAFGCMAVGILTIFGGIIKINVEKNSAYSNTMLQAQEVLSQYDLDEADRLFDEAGKISESRIETYTGKIYLSYLRGDYTECIRTGRNYINTIPFRLKTGKDRECYGNICYIIGNAYFETKDYANAEEMFEYALEYNGQNGLYYRDYAITLAKAGRAKEAEEQLAKGKEMGISQDSVYMVQGEIACTKGQYEAALHDLTQAVLYSDDMETKKRAVLLCAEAYKSTGDQSIDEEIALLEEYGGQFEGKGNYALEKSLAEAYARKAQTDETVSQEYSQKALNLLETLCENGYITYQVQKEISALYQNLGRFQEAETLLRQLANSCPEEYEVYKLLAYLEADKQQLKENDDRNYEKMCLYYEKAREKYMNKEQDMEMEMLDSMIRDLKDGGWIK